MIRSEFIKLHKQKIFIVIAVVMFLIPVATQLLFNNFVKTPKYWNYYIAEYSNIQEIDIKIADLITMKESLDKSIPYYEEEVNIINDSIRIYEYLKINNLKYDDVINFSGYDLTKDNSSMLSVFSLIVSITILIISSFLCGIVINKDFSLGTANLVYGGKKIKKRLFSKLFVIYSITFLCLLFFLACCFIFSKNGNYKCEYFLFVFSSGVSVLKSSAFLGKIICSLLFDYVLISLFTTMVSILIKKRSAFYLTQIIIICFIVGIMTIMQNDFISAYFSQYVMALSFGYGGLNYIFIFLSKIVVLFVFNLFAVKRFSKRDMY